MKILYPLFIISLLCFPSISRAQREMNRIIIWDVTQSMIGVTKPNDPPNYGYDPKHDIFGAVKKGIIDVIDRAASDNSGTIRILQFRQVVLKDTLFPNTSQGRQKAIDFVNGYKIYKDHRSAGSTNICGAWEDAIQYLNPSKRNVIYLFTDGEQNVPNGPYGNDCLPHLINTYCTLTQNTDAFTFFISLGVKNNPLASKLRNACPKKAAYMTVTHLIKNGIPSLVNMRAKFDTLFFNIQDVHPESTERFEVIGSKLPPDFSMNATLHLSSKSLPIDVSENIKSVNGEKCDVRFTLTDVNPGGFTNLRNQLNRKVYGKLVLKNTTKGNSLIRINPTAIPIVILNKKPETLNFKVK